MIRRLEYNDIDDVINLENNILNTTLGKEMLISSINSLMSYYYVYIIDNKLVGYISSSFDGEVIEILNFCVYQEYQNKGIGTKLICHLINELYKLGALSSILEVREANVKVINFYKRIGYKIINIRKNYYSNGDNALLMQKLLTSYDDILLSYHKHFCNIINNDDYIEYKNDNFKEKYDFNKYIIKNEDNIDNIINKIKKENNRSFLEINTKYQHDNLSNDMIETYCGIMYNNIYNINFDIKFNNIKEFDINDLNNYIEYCYNEDLEYDIEYAKLNGKFISNILLNNKNFKSFLIYDNNKLIGKLDAYIYLDNVYIENYSILKDYRFNGYGSSLFMSSINKLKELGVSNVYLEVDNYDTPIEMYKKWGFCIIDNYYTYHEDY